MACSRRFIKVLSGLCGLLAVAAAAMAVQSKPGPSGIGMETELGATDAKVSVAQLVSEYLADERAADQRYRLKTVEVSGVMLGLDRGDPQVAAVMVGKQLGGREFPCACQGGPALEAQAAPHREGERIRVRGKFAGLLMSRMALLHCEIVD
jgi:hypothetical protein